MAERSQCVEIVAPYWKLPVWGHFLAEPEHGGEIWSAGLRRPHDIPGGVGGCDWGKKNICSVCSHFYLEMENWPKMHECVCLNQQIIAGGHCWLQKGLAAISFLVLALCQMLILATEFVSSTANYMQHVLFYFFFFLNIYIYLIYILFSVGER